MATTRHCRIVNAECGNTESADGDGAYSLFGVKGSPEEVGEAITETLREIEVMQGSSWFPDCGPVYVKILVEISREAE